MTPNPDLDRGLVLFPLQVKEEMLLEALTTRKTMTVGERLIVPYKLAEVTFIVTTNIHIQHHIKYTDLSDLLKLMNYYW